MKVMVIDDSKTMRNIQKNILTQLGHTEIEEACDGQDALSKVDAFKPDLVHVVNPVSLGLAGIRYARRRKVPLVHAVVVCDTGLVTEAELDAHARKTIGGYKLPKSWTLQSEPLPLSDHPLCRSGQFVGLG